MAPTPVASPSSPSSSLVVYIMPKSHRNVISVPTAAPSSSRPPKGLVMTVTLMPAESTAKTASVGHKNCCQGLRPYLSSRYPPTMSSVPPVRSPAKACQLTSLPIRWPDVNASASDTAVKAANMARPPISGVGEACNLRAWSGMSRTP